MAVQAGRRRGGLGARGGRGAGVDPRAASSHPPGGGYPPGCIEDSKSSEKTGKKRVSIEVGGRGAGGDQTPHERGMAIAASAPP